MAERRKRRGASVSSQALLYPINVLDFGDPEKDPCFGKLYDLNEEECQACGDIELCSVVFSQKKLVPMRLKAEKDSRAKDLEFSKLEHHRNVKDYFKRMNDEGLSKVASLKKAARRYHLKIKTVKTIINGR